MLNLSFIQSQPCRDSFLSLLPLHFVQSHPHSPSASFSLRLACPQPHSFLASLPHHFVQSQLCSISASILLHMVPSTIFPDDPLHRLLPFNLLQLAPYKSLYPSICAHLPRWRLVHVLLPRRFAPSPLMAPHTALGASPSVRPRLWIIRIIIFRFSVFEKKK